MAIPVFYPNQVVKFATNYQEGKEADLTGWRYYLLWKIDQELKVLIFFTITSNHNFQDSSFVSQFKITQPRPPCLQSEFYPNSFVNTNRLVIVPFKLDTYLKFCQKCAKHCLIKEDFQGIIQLHNDLPKYYKGIKIKPIELNEDNFK